MHFNDQSSGTLSMFSSIKESHISPEMVFRLPGVLDPTSAFHDRTSHPSTIASHNRDENAEH